MIANQVASLSARATNDVSLTQPLSGDLVNVHKPDEDDLFFEVAIGETAN